MPGRATRRSGSGANGADSKSEVTPEPASTPQTRKRLRPRPSEADYAPMAPTPVRPPKRPRIAPSKRAGKSQQSGPEKKANAALSNDDPLNFAYPSPEEWENKSVFVRYKTCQLNGQQWATGDFVEVKADAESSDGSENWIAKIQHIRASGGTRVFCGVHWVYTSRKMLVQYGCRNPPDTRSVQFPSEVVLGVGDGLSQLISIQCINDSISVAHFDEGDPLQPQIPYDGNMFYRSLLRLPTTEEVKKEAKTLTQKYGSKVPSKVWGESYPIHQFEHKYTCTCKQRYMPLPPGTGAMIYCPRQTCLNENISGPEVVSSLLESGLDLLERDRQSDRADYLCQNAPSSDDVELPLSFFTRIPRDETGIPRILRHTAESSITRGTRICGIVGSARPILEARDLHRALLASMEEAGRGMVPGAAKRGRGKAKVEDDPQAIVESWDPVIRRKLGIWLKLFGGKKVDADIAMYRKTRTECWICPGCKEAI